LARLNSITYSPIALPGFAPVRIRLATQIRDFAEFWPRWNTPGEARCYPFQCADILELYCDTFVPVRNGEPLFVAILGCDGEPLMLIPLVIQPYSDYTRIIKNVRILKFLDFWFSDYNAPVVFPRAATWDIKAIQIIWKALRKLLPSFDIAVFEKMPERVSDLPNPLSLLKMASDRYTGHAAHLSGEWEDFASRLPNRKRWRTRRFRELGERSLTLATTTEKYDVFIEALIRQTRQRYPRALSLPDEVAYLKAARRLIYPNGPVCLFALKVDDTVIATEFCLLRERWMIGQLLSHEAGSWQPYAPGHILNTMVCEWCFANGIEVLDFGIGDYPYKKEYCNAMIKLARAELPANMRGRLASYWRTAGDWRRERRQRFALESRSSALAQRKVPVSLFKEWRLFSMWRVRLYILTSKIAHKTLYRYPHLRSWVRTRYWFRTFMPILFNLDPSFSGRRYLTEVIFPAITSSTLRRVLFVGCKAYTARYGRNFAHAGIEYWTTDIAPEAAIWGEEGHHIVCDIAKIDEACPAESFDAVLLNGVLGDGVDDENEMNRAITAIAHILRPNGVLLIGWNSDNKEYPDPMSVEAISMYFRREGVLPLPVTKTFRDSPVIYNWLVKANVADANRIVASISGQKN
jgi:CelD/BcsL family acetyltransferase involved in cellulose biosynthesis/SAM-dependent methyltransferase